MHEALPRMRRPYSPPRGEEEEEDGEGNEEDEEEDEAEAFRRRDAEGRREAEREARGEFAKSTGTESCTNARPLFPGSGL